MIRGLVVTVVILMLGGSADGVAGERILLTSITAYPGPRLSDAELATRYDFVILQSGEAGRVARLKRLNPALKVLFYRFPHASWRWQEDWAEITRYEDWFLHDAEGRRTRRAQGDETARWYLMDLRNEAFRIYQANYISRHVQEYGFDGAFVDGPPGALQGWIGLDPDAPRDAKEVWHRNVLVFLSELKRALGEKLLISNSTTTYETGIKDTDDSDYLVHTDGTMIEGFAHAPWQTYNEMPRRASWDWQQRMFQRNLDAGKYTFVLSGVRLRNAPAHEVRRWQIFSYASYLLRADGVRSIYQWNYVNVPNFFPEMHLDIGIPLGSFSREGEVYVREFSRGKVLVNPTDQLQLAEVGGGYRTGDGSPVGGRIGLSGWTGVVLARVGGP